MNVLFLFGTNKAASRPIQLFSVLLMLKLRGDESHF